jgi:general stress protein 26
MQRRDFLHSASSLGFGAALAPLFGIGDARAAVPGGDRTAALVEDDLIYLSTRRKSGEWSSQAPIWFWFHDDTIYFTCSPESWKAKRLKEGGPVRIRVGSEKGPEIVGEATRIHDLMLIDRLGEAWGNKYWIAWFGLFRPRRDRIESGKTYAYRVKLD